MDWSGKAGWMLAVPYFCGSPCARSQVRLEAMAQPVNPKEQLPFLSPTPGVQHGTKGCLTLDWGGQVPDEALRTPIPSPPLGPCSLDPPSFSKAQKKALQKPWAGWAHYAGTWKRARLTRCSETRPPPIIREGNQDMERARDPPKTSVEAVGETPALYSVGC